MVTVRDPWDRREGETSRAYEAFRAFRDLGPLRTLGEVDVGAPSSVARWSHRFDWVARATAWDDALHMTEDARRLEAIATMRDSHAAAGRVAIEKALAALGRLEDDEVPAAAAVRLLEVGTRLERQTLLDQVEEAAPVDASDPWERIARELGA